MHTRGILDLRRQNELAAPAERSLRLGVLTFSRCINYGSYWQARCLVDGLRAMGHDPVLLDHRDPAIDRAEWRCALQPLLPVRSPREDRRRYARKVRVFHKAIRALPHSAPFALGKPVDLAAFDAVVIGSDEVWNPSHPWYGGAGAFWGWQLQATRLIAHAASCGHHPTAFPGDCARALGRFTAIAVRDATTRERVREATGEDPPLVLDPCLQFPPPPAAPLLRSPYALVYGHEFPEWFGPLARRWAHRRGLRLLSIGYRCAFADDQWLEANPGGFASAVAGAQAMLTTMFHGCVFALNAGLPFAAVSAPYRATKLGDLAVLLGAERHLLGPGADFDAVLSRPPGPAIHARIADLRAGSHATLRRALA